ncbi:MAG: ABC transporter permease [Saprospiraceae bacterium]|nr:ABC transporter permease [Saprospiraceae bacterium]
MIGHYIKIAFRSIQRDKISAFINIFGLATALTSVVLILLFVQYELGYDRGHSKADRIYRLNFESKNQQTRLLATVSPPMGPAMARTFPEVEKATRVRYTDEVILTYEEQHYYQKGFIYADSTFLDVFDFPLQAGDAQSALQEPNSIILTPEAAERYFGKVNPIGKIVLLDDEIPLKVTGVFAETPTQTHLKFDIVASFSTFRVPYGYPVTLESWTWISFQTYLLLKEGASIAQLETKFPKFISDNMGPDRVKTSVLHTQPLKDIYFHSGHLMNTDANRQGNFAYVKGLSLVAFLILLVAAFNFMNITIARSVNRGREVRVRKVLGAMPIALFRQFLGEAVLLATFSLALAMVLLALGKDYLLQWLAWDMRIEMTDFVPLIPVLIGLAIVAGGLTGLYPAFLLSRFKPTRVLKGEIKTGYSGIVIRKALVVAQFVIMTGLAVGSLAVKQQMDFIQNRDLGFDKEQVIALQLQTPDFLNYYERGKKFLNKTRM